MTPERTTELKATIEQMRIASSLFYAQVTHIGNHPFIEFTGLMNEYIDCCVNALAQGIDFTKCNTHRGQQLPMANYQVKYTNEKLECIYTGRAVIQE